MKEIKIVSRWDSSKVLLCGKYESIKDCLEKNRGANLGGADLRSADLGGAYLRSAKNYLSSHDFFQEVIRRQPVKTFTQAEWASIAQIIIHKLCWDTIKNKHKTSAMRVFKKCSKVGFDEWEKHFKELK